MRRTGPTLLTSLAVVLLAAACGPDDRPRPPPEHERVLEQEKQMGRDLFLRQGCATCHTIDENDYAAKEAPDFTYFGFRPKVDSSTVHRALHPDLPPPGKAPDHPKISDENAREVIARFLTHSCRPGQDYVVPDYEGDRRAQSYCPVTGLRVQNDSAESRTYGGRTYYFATPSAARKFDQNPGHFAR